MTTYYVLDSEHNPIEATLDQWSRCFDSFKRRNVDQTSVEQDGEKIQISTVFLGVDHGFTPKGLPLLFETLVFGGINDGLMDRYATWNEAKLGHQKVVAIVKNLIH